MLDIEMPEQTIGSIQDEKLEIARGPFVAVHNGDLLLAGYMAHASDGELVVFKAGDRSHTIDESYTIFAQDNSTLAYSEEFQSTWLFRPLQVEDADWLLFDGETVGSLEELVALASDEIAYT